MYVKSLINPIISISPSLSPRLPPPFPPSLSHPGLTQIFHNPSVAFRNSYCSQRYVSGTGKLSVLFSCSACGRSFVHGGHSTKPARRPNTFGSRKLTKLT